MAAPSKIMIYGATGYVGKMVVKEAIQQGIAPIILASRNGDVRDMARQYGLEYRIFNLENPFVINKMLDDISVLVNLAGPFSQTTMHMVNAVIRTKANYLDISGEIPEFEILAKLDAEAKEAGSMLMPGVGFGVVPTDLLAQHLKAQMPDAQKLTLSYVTLGSASQGSLKTVLKDILTNGFTRRNGVLEPIKPAQDIFEFTFKGKKYKTYTNQWRADIVSAYHTTGIPNIETYMYYPWLLVKMMHYVKNFNWIWKHDYIQWAVSRAPEGPSAKQLAAGSSIIYGRVENGTEVKEAVMTGPEAYIFTVQSVVAIMKRVAALDYKTGFQTPASLYGTSLLKSLKGVEITDL